LIQWRGDLIPAIYRGTQFPLSRAGDVASRRECTNRQGGGGGGGCKAHGIRLPHGCRAEAKSRFGGAGEETCVDYVQWPHEDDEYEVCVCVCMYLNGAGGGKGAVRLAASTYRVFSC